MLPGIFGLAFFPAMTRYGEKSPADAARLGERALRFILVGIVPVTLLVMFISGPIIHWFEDSSRWDDSITVMMTNTQPGRRLFRQKNTSPVPDSFHPLYPLFPTILRLLPIVPPGRYLSSLKNLSSQHMQTLIP